MDAHNFIKTTILHHTSSYMFLSHSSGSLQLYKTVASSFLLVAAENSSLCNIYVVDRFVH